MIATVRGSPGLKRHGSSNSACSTKQASSNHRDLWYQSIRILFPIGCLRVFSPGSQLLVGQFPRPLQRHRPCIGACAFAQDFVSVAPQARVLKDDGRIRVIDYAPNAGDKLPMHSHPTMVVYLIRRGDEIYAGRRQNHRGQRAGWDRAYQSSCKPLTRNILPPHTPFSCRLPKRRLSSRRPP